VNAAKSIYRDSENLSEFVDCFGFGEGNVFFMTVTFKHNQDKSKCAEAWNLFKSYLNKPSVRQRFMLPDSNFHYISVWERHKKGGWHLHILGSIKGISTSRLRSLIRNFLSVTASIVGFIHVVWTRGHNGNGIKYYMTKYLCKECRLKGVRYVNYSRNWVRRVKGDFAFAWGRSALWRKRCLELDQSLPLVFKFFYKNASFEQISSALHLFENPDWRLTPEDVVLRWIDHHAPGLYSYLADAVTLGRFPNLEVMYDDFKNIIAFRKVYDL